MTALYISGAFLIAVIYFKIFNIKKGWKNALILGGAILAFFLIVRALDETSNSELSRKIDEQKSKTVYNIMPDSIKKMLSLSYVMRCEYVSTLGLSLKANIIDHTTYIGKIPSRGNSFDEIYLYNDGRIYVVLKKRDDYERFLSQIENKATSIKDPIGACKAIYDLGDDCYLCAKGLFAYAHGYSLLFTKGTPLKFKNR